MSALIKSCNCGNKIVTASGHRFAITECECQARLHELLLEIEMHCPCGARPETPNSHPHVGGCPVYEALRLLSPIEKLSCAAESERGKPRK